MKIAMLSNSIQGGIWNHSKYLSYSLAGHGHTVEMFAKKPPGMGIAHHRMKAISVHAFDYYYNRSGILNRLRTIKPDVIHTHHQLFNLDFYLSKIRRLGFPLVSTLHVAPSKASMLDKIVNIYFNKARKNLSSADELIVVSKFMKNAFEELGLSGINVIPNGVDTSMFYPEPDAKSILGMPEDEFALLFVGRMMPEKGINKALRAASRINGARLYVIGSGPLLSMARMYAKKHNNITIVGRVSDDLLRMYYSAADLFVFPSIWQEAFGMVITEAMACGTPTIAYSVGGVPEIIDGRNGRLVEEKSSVALRKAIQGIMDGPFSEGTGKLCVNHVKRHYSWDMIAEQTAKVYRRAVG